MFPDYTLRSTVYILRHGGRTVIRFVLGFGETHLGYAVNEDLSKEDLALLWLALATSGVFADQRQVRRCRDLC